MTDERKPRRIGLILLIGSAAVSLILAGTLVTLFALYKSTWAKSSLIWAIVILGLVGLLGGAYYAGVVWRTWVRRHLPTTGDWKTLLTFVLVVVAGALAGCLVLLSLVLVVNLIFKKQGMTNGVMLILFVVGVLGAMLGAFYTVVDWKTRGRRYLLTLAVAVATLCFSGWLLWGYKAPRKPKDYEVVKNRVVRELTEKKQKKASRLSIKRLGKTVVFEKQEQRWMIVKPIKFPADHDAVENLLTEIRMLDRDKILPGPRTKAEYGLTGDSAIVVRVEGALGAPLILTVGGKDVTGAKVYLAKNNETKVYVVNKHFRDALDKDLRELRDTAVFKVKPTKVREIALTSPEGQQLQLTVKKKSWTLRIGSETFGQRANAKTADELLRKLGDLRATQFLADGKAALSQHGLDKPAGVIVVDDGQKHRLVLGGPCPKRRDEQVAGRRGKFPTVFCLRAKEVKELLPKVEDLRDARLAGVEETEVTAIQITAGQKEVLLKKTGLDWKVEKPTGGKIKKAQFSQVEQFLKDLRSYTVLKFIPPPPEGLAKFGLDKPRAVLTLTTEGGRQEVVKLGSEDPDKNYYAQRSGEKLVVVVHRAAGQLLAPTLLRFRDRSLITFAKQPNEAVEITATHGAISEKLVYEGGLWQMKKPVAVKADTDSLDGLLSVLSQFTVERFVAERPAPIHGLAVPTRVITLKLEKEDFSNPDKPGKKSETHTIKIGADAAKGGCYGQLTGKDAPVFLLKADQCRDLRALLANLRLADVRTTKVTELKLTRGGGTEHLERRATHWGRKAGPRVSDTAVEELLTRLAAMRATRVVAYGPPQPQHGVARPVITVEITTKEKDAKPVALKIGAPLKENNKVVGHYAQRQGRNVIYLVRLADVEALRKAKF